MSNESQCRLCAVLNNLWLSIPVRAPMGFGVGLKPALASARFRQRRGGPSALGSSVGRLVSARFPNRPCKTILVQLGGASVARQRAQ